MCGVGYGAQPTWVNCADIIIKRAYQPIPWYFEYPDYDSLYASVDATNPGTISTSTPTSSTTETLTTVKLDDTTTFYIPVIKVQTTTPGTGQTTTGSTEAPPSETPVKIIDDSTTSPNRFTTAMPLVTPTIPTMNQLTTVPLIDGNTVPNSILTDILSAGGGGFVGQNNTFGLLLPLLAIGALLGPLIDKRASEDDLFVLQVQRQLPVPFFPIAWFGMPHFIPNNKILVDKKNSNGYSGYGINGDSYVGKARTGNGYSNGPFSGRNSYNGQRYNAPTYYGNRSYKPGTLQTPVINVRREVMSKPTVIKRPVRVVQRSHVNNKNNLAVKLTNTDVTYTLNSLEGKAHLSSNGYGVAYVTGCERILQTCKSKFSNLFFETLCAVECGKEKESCPSHSCVCSCV